MLHLMQYKFSNSHLLWNTMFSKDAFWKIYENRDSKSFPLYVPLMKDLPIIPPHGRIFKSLFTHLKQHIVTSFQIENGLYCLNKVNSNRQLRGYLQFILFAQETCYSYLIVSFLSISDFNYFTANGPSLLILI